VAEREIFYLPLNFGLEVIRVSKQPVTVKVVAGRVKISPCTVPQLKPAHWISTTTSSVILCSLVFGALTLTLRYGDYHYDRQQRIEISILL
jgi:hypothetical protein